MFWENIFWLKVIILSLLQIFSLRRIRYPQIIVLEHKADEVSEIEFILEACQPYIGIAMVAGAAAPQIERLPGNGFAALNFDDKAVLNLKERTRARVITFGFDDGADLKISNFIHNSSFKLIYGGTAVPVAAKNIFGRDEAYAAATAACVGLIFDLNLVEISEAIQNSNWVK